MKIYKEDILHGSVLTLGMICFLLLGIIMLGLCNDFEVILFCIILSIISIILFLIIQPIISSKAREKKML